MNNKKYIKQLCEVYLMELMKIIIHINKSCRFLAVVHRNCDPRDDSVNPDNRRWEIPKFPIEVRLFIYEHCPVSGPTYLCFDSLLGYPMNAIQGVN